MSPKSAGYVLEVQRPSWPFLDSPQLLSQRRGQAALRLLRNNVAVEQGARRGLK